MRDLVVGFVPWLLAACASTSGTEPLMHVERTERHMGTAFRVVAYGADEGHVARAIDAAFARIAELDATLSDWDPHSELSRLSHAPVGEPQAVSEDLFQVLERAQAVSSATGGAFDVTVGPAVVLWRRAARQRELPAPQRLSRALAAIGHEKVRLDQKRRRVTLTAPAMRLDLGGIGKGFAADAALEVLREHDVGRALVDAGGDVVAGDPPPGATGWVIGLLADPGDADARVGIRIANCAVATSGDLFRFVEIDGVRYSHIVDPHTALGVVGRRQATVVAPDGALADALASAACVLEPPDAVAAVAAFGGASVLVRRTAADGVTRSWRSPGFPPCLEGG